MHIPKFEHHSIASGGYHSVRSLTVLVVIVNSSTIPEFLSEIIKSDIL